jgi:hypothetical protein
LVDARAGSSNNLDNTRNKMQNPKIKKRLPILSCISTANFVTLFRLADFNFVELLCAEFQFVCLAACQIRSLIY